MLWGEAECNRYLEVLQRLHLPVEPAERILPKPIRPAETRPEMGHAEPLKPFDGFVKPWVLIMEPLHDAHLGRVAREMLQRRLRAAVLADQAHVEKAVKARPFRLSVAQGRDPALGLFFL